MMPTSQTHYPTLPYPILCYLTLPYPTLSHPTPSLPCPDLLHPTRHCSKPAASVTQQSRERRDVGSRGKASPSFSHSLNGQLLIEGRPFVLSPRHNLSFKSVAKRKGPITNAYISNNTICIRKQQAAGSVTVEGSQQWAQVVAVRGKP